MATSIRQQAKNYIVSAIALTLMLCGASNLFLFTGWANAYQWPVVVSALFNVVVAVAIAMLWRWVTEKHHDMLTMFYSYISGFRMLAALAVLTGCFIAVGRDAMAPYVLVFMIFYIVGLIHHTFYFSRFIINNK